MTLNLRKISITSQFVILFDCLFSKLAELPHSLSTCPVASAEVSPGAQAPLVGNYCITEHKAPGEHGFDFIVMNETIKISLGEHLTGQNKKKGYRRLKRMSEMVWCFNQCSTSQLKRKILSSSISILQANRKVVSSECGFHCVFTFISQHPESAEEDFWRGKVFANQCIGQHVTEYFWPVGCGCALIKGEYSVWKSQLAQGSRTSWGQNSPDWAVGLILWCLRELVDAPAHDFLKFCYIKQTHIRLQTFIRSDSVPETHLGGLLLVQCWIVELIDLGELTLDYGLPTQHVLLEP